MTSWYVPASWTKILLCCNLACLLIILMVSYTGIQQKPLQTDSIPKSHAYSHWPPLRIADKHLQSCLTLEPSGTIETMRASLNAVNKSQLECRAKLKIFNQIFMVDERSGSIAIDTKDFKAKVRAWLGYDDHLYETVYHQNVISVYNKYTSEEAMFNPLRSKRPISRPDVPETVFIEKLSKKTSTECDFCNYKKFTARDIDGRLESAWAHTAANVFRYEALHQIVVSKTHHPLNWTRDEFIAIFVLSVKWFEKNYKENPAYNHPVIMWDLLTHAGASQVHPHVQIVLTPNKYPGVIESWRQAAERYYNDYNSNYFTDLIKAHDLLGLTAQYKSAIAFASLTPKKDNEFVVLAEKMSDDYLHLLYSIIRLLIDQKKMYTFSMSMALPQYPSSTSTYGIPIGHMPVMTRIVTRGTASEIRSDISSLELFTFYNVNSDPFKISRELRDYLKISAL